MGKTRKLRKTRKHLKPRNKYVKTKKRNYKGGAFGRNKRAAAKAAAEAAVEAAAEKKIQDEIQLKKLNLWLNKFKDYELMIEKKGENIEMNDKYKESDYLLVPGIEEVKKQVTEYDETATFTNYNISFTTSDIIRAVNKAIIYYHFKNIIQKTYNQDKYNIIYNYSHSILFETVKVYLGFDDDSVTYIFYPNVLEGDKEEKIQTAIQYERRKIKKNINNYVNIKILDKEVDKILNYNALADYIFEPTEKLLFGDGCYQRDGYMIMGIMRDNIPLTHILIKQGKIYEGKDNEITEMITKCIKRETDVIDWRNSYEDKLDVFSGDVYIEQYPYDSNAITDRDYIDHLFDLIDENQITIEEY